MPNKTLFFVSNDNDKDILQEEGVYHSVIHHPTVYHAVKAVQSMDRQQLAAITAFALKDNLPLVAPSPNVSAQVNGLFGDSTPAEQGSKRSVFLAGRIKAAFQRQGLTSPPIVLVTADDLTKGLFPNIDNIANFSEYKAQRGGFSSIIDNAVATSLLQRNARSA